MAKTPKPKLSKELKRSGKKAQRRFVKAFEKSYKKHSDKKRAYKKAQRKLEKKFQLVKGSWVSVKEAKELVGKRQKKASAKPKKVQDASAQKTVNKPCEKSAAQSKTLQRVDVKKSKKAAPKKSVTQEAVVQKSEVESTRAKKSKKKSAAQFATVEAAKPPKRAKTSRVSKHEDFVSDPIETAEYAEPFEVRAVEKGLQAEDSRLLEPVGEVNADKFESDPIEALSSEVETVESDEVSLAGDAEGVTEALIGQDQLANSAGGHVRPVTAATRAELYKIAQELKIAGRSTMNKEQLLTAVTNARGQA